MACYCFLCNVEEVLKDGYTAYQSKFLRDFTGKKIPFGAELEYRPSAPKDRERLLTYGNKTLSGIFVGYDQHAGGDCSGDYLVVDWDELDHADSAQEVHVKRIKEINVISLNGRPRFPLAEGFLRQRDPGTMRTRKRTRRLSWIDKEDPMDDDYAGEDEDRNPEKEQ